MKCRKVRTVLPSLKVVVEVDVFIFASEAILGRGRGLLACPIAKPKVSHAFTCDRMRGGASRTPAPGGIKHTATSRSPPPRQQRTTTWLCVDLRPPPSNKMWAINHSVRRRSRVSGRGGVSLMTLDRRSQRPFTTVWVRRSWIYHRTKFDAQPERREE